MIKCKLCEREFKLNNLLSRHISKDHNICKKEYYDKYLKKKDEGYCKECGKITKFENLNFGYHEFCSKQCSSKSIIVIKRKELTRTKIKENIKNNVECLICNVRVVSFKALSQHILNHNIDSKTYYDKYLKKDTNKCLHCGNNTKFLSLSNGYQKFCSLKCSNNNSKTKEKIKKCWNKNKIFQAKNKREATNLKRYGNKIANINLEIKKKTKNTCIRRYGVENPMKLDRFKKKSFENRRSNIKMVSFKWKNIKLPSGKIVKVQGYEDKLISKLLMCLNENDIMIHKKVPIIEYYDYDGIKRRHFPDVFVPRLNWIFECKCNYTWNPNEITRKNNILKMKYAKLKGYKYNVVLI